MSKLVLGKGLGALIPGDETSPGEAVNYKMVPLDQIRANPMQPRRDFNEERLRELADSFKINGIMQPLVVKKSDGGYAVIAGERRFRAARMAGLEKVPVVILEEIDNTRMLEMALVENIQRENLNPLELAEAYRRLIDQCHLTQNDLASRLGKSRAAVANQLRLLNLPESVQDLVRDSRLTEGHARAILTMTSEKEMLAMADSIINHTLSVRQVEKAVRHQKKRRLVPKKKLPELMEIENYLKQLLGTAVKITPGLKRGKIEIEYYGNEDLERLLEIFQSLKK
ncbi:MAG: ParB/RepB/Spo0J family partition protein [candidate division Zixibacteria bacterium]|nr:ParB/RepB/Spo0J family partition protein [candidate division Zixibacteria bacterium]